MCHILIALFGRLLTFKNNPKVSYLENNSVAKRIIIMSDIFSQFDYNKILRLHPWRYTALGKLYYSTQEF